MKLSNNFSKSEFECKCGCEMPEAVLLEVTRLANELQHIRDFVHKPMNLTNAYRCPEHNKEVGGVSNSQHILGKAADIQIEELEPSEVYKKIGPNRLSPILLSLLFALTFSVTWIFIRNYFSNGIKGIEDITSLGVSLFGTVMAQKNILLII